MWKRNTLSVSLILTVLSLSSISSIQKSLQSMQTRTESFLWRWRPACPICAFAHDAESLLALIKQAHSHARELKTASIFDYHTTYWSGIHEDIDPAMGNLITRLRSAFTVEIPYASTEDITILQGMLEDLLPMLHAFNGNVETDMHYADSYFQAAYRWLMGSDGYTKVCNFLNTSDCTLFFNTTQILNHNIKVFGGINQRKNTMRDMPLTIATQINTLVQGKPDLCTLVSGHSQCPTAVRTLTTTSNNIIQKANLFV